jgi:hypothetical protein
MRLLYKVYCTSVACYNSHYISLRELILILFLLRYRSMLLPLPLLQFFSFIGVYGNMNAQLGLAASDRDYIGSKGGIPSS